MHFVRRYILFRRYKTNSLSFFKRFLRLSFFMSYFIRAAQRFLSVALSFVLAFYPFSVQAAEIKAAQGSVAPTVYQAPNGVAMVDIVAPNSAGVSHNKYEQFNIGPSGVILNNSTAEVSQSRLGGLIGGNRNLNNNETARIILNEVTSSNRSLLQGAAEIHGRSAEFILANPYGITCNGCGFINTPQVTLTSGVPQFNADGSLHGFNVRGGDILFGERGAYLSEADVFNIVTHRVRIDGPLYVGEGSLDIATGPMAWAYNTGLITPYESQTGEDVPSYAIDSSLLGGMYAGRIRLISTQAGAGVRLRGDVASTTDGMMLSADGKLVLNRVQSQKGLDVASHASSVEFHDVAYAQEDVAVDAQTDITLGQAAILASQADVSLDAGSDVRLADGSLIVSGMAADGGRDAQSDIAISATQLESTGTGQVDAADELHITAQKIDISRSADAADGGDGLSSRGDMVLEVNQIEANNNRILSYRDIRLSGLGDIKLVSGTMIAGGDMQITSDASLDNAMSLLAYNALSVETGTVTNTGAIASYGGLSLGSGDAVLNGFENSGQLYAYDSDITIDASDFTNAGGELRSIGTGDITVDAERFTNNSGTVSAAGDLTLTGGEFSNIVDDANSLILSGGDMALSFAGDVFSNAGYLVSSGGFTLTQAGDVTNSGIIQAQGDIGFGSDAAYLSGFSQSGMIKSIDGGVSVYADGFVSDAESQLIGTGDVAVSVTDTGNVTQDGTFISQQGDIGFTGGGSWTGDGLIQAVAGGIDINGFDSFGGAARLVGHSDVVIAVDGALSLDAGGFIATQNIVDEATGAVLSSSGGVTLSGNVLSIGGQLTAQGGGVGLTASDDLSIFDTSSVFAASGLDIISGGDFATAGRVQSQGGLSIASSGNITQSGTVLSYASDSVLSLEAGSLSNTGAIASYGGLSLGSGDAVLNGFENSGQLYAYDSDITIDASDFTNAGGELRSIGTGDITVDAERFTNNSGTVSAAGDLTLTGGEFSNIVDDANSLILSGGDMALSFAGDVFSNAGYLVSSGGFTLTQAGDVTNSGIIQAQGDIGFGSDAAYLSGFSQSGMIKSIDGGVSVYADGFVSDAESQLIGTGDVAISVLGDVDNNGALASFDGDIGFTGAGSWTGDGLIQAVAGGIDINGFDSFGGAARLVGHGDVEVAVDGALSLDAGGFIATQNIVDAAGDTIVSGGVTLSGEVLSIAGQLTAQGGGVGLTASDDLSIFDTSSVFAASGLDIISGGDFATAGRVQSQGGLSIASSGNITQSGTVLSYASDSVLSLEAGSLSNTGAIASYGGLSLGSGDAVLNGFENSGQLYAYDSDITIDASDFTNAGGELRSIGTGDITVDAERFTNNSGTVSAAGDLTLTGGEFSNIVDDANSLILSGGDMALSFAGDVFSNAGYLVSSGGFTLTQAGDVTNSGIIQAQGDIGFGSDAAYLSGFSQSGMIKSIDGGVSVYADGFVSDAESQLIGTGDVAISVLGDVDNNGALASFDGDIGFTGAGSWTGDGLIQAVAGGIDINGFDSFGGAARLVGHGDVEVAVDGALSLDAGGFIATQNIVDAAGDTIVSGGVTLSGEVLSIAGQLTAQGGGVGLTASDDLSIFDTSSVFAASGLDIISGGDFATAGRVQSQGGLSIASSGNITQSGTVLSYASDSVLSLEAGSLSNTGAIASYGGLSLGSGDAVLNGFENSGQLYAYDSDITIDASDFTNAGGELRSIISTSDISDVDMPDVTIANIIINADSFTNNSGTVSAAGDLTLTGGEFSNIVDDANSLILSGGDMALSFAGDVFSNAGYLVSSGGFTLTQAGDVTNSGIIQAQGDIGFGSDAAYLSGFSQSGMIKSIDGGVSVYADGFVSDAESQLIAAGDVAVSVTDTGNVTQDGTFISQQGDIGFTGAGSWTGDGLIQAVAGGIDINGFDSFGGAARLVGHSDVVIAVDGALTLAEGGFIATQNIVDDATGAVLSSSGGVNLSGEVLSIAGQLTAQGGGVGLTASDDLSIFDTSSVFAASGLDIISGGDFSTAGRVQSQGGLSIASSGNITQSGTLISLASDTALSLTTTGRFSNTGAIASYGGLSLGSGDAVLNGFENSGQLYAYDSDITIDASDFTNAGGELRSIGTGDITVDTERFTNDTASQLIGVGDVAINVLGHVNNNGTLVSFERDINLTGSGSGSWTGNGVVQAVAGGIDINGFDSFGGAARLVGHSDVVIAVDGDIELNEGGFVATQNIVDEAGETILSGGVNLSGEALSIAGQVSAQGGELSLKASDGGLSISDTASVFSASGLDIISGGDFANAGTVKSQQGDIDLTGSGSGSYTGNGLVQAVAGGIDINGFDSFGGAARLVGHSDVVIAVDGALSLAEGGFIATQNIVDAAGDTIVSGGVNLSGEALSIAGQLTAQGGGVGLTASDDLSIFDTSSVFAASGLDIISGGDFATAGRVQSQGGLSIASSGNITQSGTLISLASDSVLSLEAGSLSNTGAIASYGGLSLGFGDAVLNAFENSGQLYAYDSDVDIHASAFTNAGGELRSIISTSDISDADILDVTIANIIINADSFTNNAGTVSAAGDLAFTGKSLYNYGGYTVDNMPDNRGLIYAGGVLDVNLSSILINKSYIISDANLNLNLGGTYDNHAKIQSGGVLTLQGEGNSYLGGLSTKAGSVLNGIGGLTIKTTGLVNRGAVLSSAGDIHVHIKNAKKTGGLLNYDTIQSGGSSHFYLEGGFTNHGGSIFAGQNITVEKITNQDTPNGGTIIHGGKINTLLNLSGTIESRGNIDIYANDISNKRTQFSVTKTSKTTENNKYIHGENVSYTTCTEGTYLCWNKIEGTADYLRTTKQITETLKTASAEAVIKAGANLNLNAKNTVENKQSSLYAVKNLSISGKSFINQGERVESYTISDYTKKTIADEYKFHLCINIPYISSSCANKPTGWIKTSSYTRVEDLGFTKDVKSISKEFEARVRGGKEVKINLTGNLNNKEMGFITSGSTMSAKTNGNITNEGVFWSGGTSLLYLDGTLINKNGADIVAGNALTIKGKAGDETRADAIINQASTMESMGNLYLYADEVVNEIGLKPVKKLKSWKSTKTGSNYVSNTTHYKEIYAISPGEAGQIISGRNLEIKANVIENDHSALNAGWQLRTNVTIEQSGTELQEWSETVTKTTERKKNCKWTWKGKKCKTTISTKTDTTTTPKTTYPGKTASISAKDVVIDTTAPQGVTDTDIQETTLDTNTLTDISTDIAGDTDGSIPDTDVDETMFKDGVDVDSEDPSTQIEGDASASALDIDTATHTPSVNADELVGAADDIVGDDSASALDIDTATDTPSVNADELVGAADDITGDSEAAYIDNQTLVSDDYDIDSADMAADDMEVPEPPVFVPPAQNGLFTDIDIPTNNEPAPPGKAVSLSTLTNSIDALSRRSLFKTRPEGDTPYQIETRIEFLDASAYYGSDYFIEKYNHDGNESLRRLGDSFAETRLIRAQVQELTGRHSVSADSANEQAMIKTLYDNAYAAQQSLELTPGVSLSAEQVAALQEDIIWLEKQQVNGEEVLVPRVYLADARALGFATSIYGQENVSITADSYTTTSSDSLVSDGNMFITTVEEFTHEGHLEVANAAVFNVGTDFTNMVDLDAAYIEVNAGGDILNDNAALTSTGDLLLTAGGMMHNLSGQISGGTVSIIAQDILNETEIDREYNGRNNYADTLGDVASISATGSMSLIAANSITIAGAELTAGGSLLMDANSVTVTALALEEQFSGKRGGWKVNEYQKTLASSSITSGGDMVINADQNISILGSDLTATGAVGLSTLNGDITIAAMQEVLSKTRKKTKKKSWGRRKTTTETTLDITNQMANITGGAGISLSSGNNINVFGGELQTDGTLSSYAAGETLVAHVKDVYEKSRTVKKRGFGGLSGSNRGKSTSQQFSQASTLDAVMDVVVGSAGSTTLIASAISAGNNAIVKAGIDAEGNIIENLETPASVNILAGMETTQTRSFSSQYKAGMNGTSVGYSQDSIENVTTTNNSVSSSITAGNSLLIDGDTVKLVGADINAQNNVDIIATNDVTISAAQNSVSTVSKQKSMSVSVANAIEGLINDPEYLDHTIQKERDVTTTTHITLNSGEIASAAGSINITSRDQDINLKAANLNAAQDINLTTLSEEGSVNMQVGKEISQVDKTKTKSSIMVEGNKWSGSYDETLVYTEMQTGNGGKVNFNTENINVDYLDPTAKSSSGAQSGGGLQSFIVPLVLSENLQRQKAEGQVDDIVAANDNLSWMQDLTGDERVNWTGVEETHTSYSESSKNLTQAGALIVSIAVTAATGGIGAGVTGSALSAAASSAAVLGSNAALNSGGSFNDFMDTMTDKDTLQQIATSAVTAAVTAGAADWAAGTADSVVGATSNSSTFMHQAGHYAVEVTAQSAIQAGADAILSGGDWNDMRDNFTDGFESRLVSNIASSAISRGDSLGDDLGDKVAKASNDFLGKATDVVVDSVTETAVNALVEVGKGGSLSDFGDAFQDNFEDTFRKNAAEAANEAISSEIGTQAKVGELTDGEHGIGTATQLGLHALTGCASAALQSGDCGAGALGQVTGEVVGMLYNENTDMADIDGDGYISDSEESVWRDKGIELAGNVTQAVLTATGADAHDIAIGTTNGTIAAENNALFLIPVAVVALEVIDKGLIAYDTYKLAEAANNCNNGDMAACGVATEMSQDLAIAAGIEATVGNLVPGSQAVAKLVNKLGKSDNAPNVVNNTAVTNPATKGNTTGDSPGNGTPNTEQPNQHNVTDNDIFETGANISPQSTIDNYPTIGKDGTFVTEVDSIENVIGPIPDAAKEIRITRQQANDLEYSLGIRGNLEETNTLSIIDDIPNRCPRCPVGDVGNEQFLGGGQGLPGGGSELIIDSIPTSGAEGIKQIKVIIE